MAPSTSTLRLAARHAAGRLVLIGVGGIATGADILTKLRAGASLVQVYTALSYEGPALVERLLRELLTALDAQGFSSVSAAIGADL
jgi:dihydroorotate dehydrogenase